METTAPPPGSSRWAAPFFTIWTGQASSLFGSQLIQFALIWWLTNATGSATVLAATFVIGFSMPITNGPLLAAVQAVVALDMPGRVFMLIGSAVAAMSPLGLIIAAPVADAFGVQTWFVIGGVVTILMGVAGYFIPAVIHLEGGREVEISTPADPSALVTSAAASAIDGD